MKIPTIRKSGLSRRAKNICARMGLESEDLVTDIEGGYNDFIAMRGCGVQTALEISKLVTKYRRENGEHLEPAG